MAITFVGAGAQVNTASPGTLSPPLPTGWAENDIFLLHLFSRTTSVTWTPPAPWTADGYSASGSATKTMADYYKRATASEAAPSISISDDTGGWSAQISAWRGVITTGSPLDATTVVQVNAADNSQQSPSIITITDGAMVIKLYGTADDNTLTTFSAPQAEAYGGVNYSTIIGTDHSVGCGYYIKATAGASGTDTVVESIGGPDTGVAFALALKPDTGGSPPPVTNFPPLLRSFDPTYLRI